MIAFRVEALNYDIKKCKKIFFIFYQSVKMDLYAVKPLPPPGTLFFTGAANRTFLECHLNIASAQNLCELHYCRAQYQRKSSVVFPQKTKHPKEYIHICCRIFYVAYCIPGGLHTKRPTIVFFLGPTKPLPSY
jgi:hypothetical protein